MCAKNNRIRDSNGPGFCGAIVATWCSSRAQDRPSKLNMYFDAATGPKLGKIYKGFGYVVNSSHLANFVSPSTDFSVLFLI